MNAFYQEKLNVIVFLLAIVSLAVSTRGNSQVFDTIGENHINYVDSLGQRQGLWEIKNKIIIASGHRCYGSKSGCQYFEQAEYYLKAKGYYFDNQKVGKWSYYSGNSLNNLEREVFYRNDGKLIEKNFYPNYELSFNQDSSLIQGCYFHYIDSLNIDCRNKNCLFSLSSGEEVTSFNFENYEDFEYQFLRLTSSQYDRTIRRLIAFKN